MGSDSLEDSTDDVPEWLEGFPGFRSPLDPSIREQVTDLGARWLNDLFTPEMIERRTEAVREHWKTRCRKAHGQRISEGYANRDPEKVELHRRRQSESLARTNSDPGIRKKRSEAAKTFGARPEVRKRRSEAAKARWARWRAERAGK